MGMTLLCVRAKGSSLRLYVSNEYDVTKKRDAAGKVLPDQEWQHPEANTLRYTAFGRFGCPESFESFLNAWLQLGVGQFGGHVRFIEEDAAAIVNGRQQSWDAKLSEDEARSEEMEAERERERYREHCLEQERRAPHHDWCGRCGASQEVCKNHAHRGNRCMQCSGGIGDGANRYCRNCLDLPYRELREKVLGAPIVYTGEEEKD
jgi:hypothetical protein